MARMLESEEAARRLGIKLSTLYAYVSRGQLGAHRAAGGRRSLFDVDEVEALARRSRGGRRVESRLATVTTAVTQIRDDGPLYRGRPVVDLAGRWTFEEVAELLWAPGRPEAERAEAAPAARAPAARALARPPGWAPWAVGSPPLPSAADRLRWALVMAGAGDPLRSDLRPEAVVRAARRVVATLAAALAAPAPAAGSTAAGSAAAGSTAAGPPNPSAYTGGWVARTVTAHLLGSGAGLPGIGSVAPVVDAALVLLADHELATSTLAVRVAASTRADLYDALAAGLGTLSGPLHGGASGGAHALLAAASSEGPARALDDALRWPGTPPGFGHQLYAGGDRRATALLALVRPLVDERRWAVVQGLVDLAAAEDLARPNVDLGLAALSWGTGLAPDAGRSIFTIARLAGWVAHYLEELDERPLRFRARAVYATA